MASRWARILKADAELAAKYKACDSNKARAEFRQRWAKLQFETFQEKRVQLSSHTKSVTELGVMYSLGRIAVEEGGGKQGMANAINYALSCIADKTGGMIEYDWRARATKYNYIVKQKRDESKESWQATRVWSASSQSSTATTPATTPQTPHTPKPKPKAGPEGKGDSNKKKAAPSSLTKARQVITRYTTVVGRADMLIGNIKNNSDGWQWANNPHMLTDLVQSRQKLADAVQQDAFTKTVLAIDISEAKKAFSAGDFEVGLATLPSKISEALNNVAREVKLLVSQQQARQAAM